MTDHPDYIHVGGGDPSLYNEDLAPVPHQRRNWGAFEIFNVWNNDIQSLFGYTLAASLFLSYGLNGWLTFAAIVVAGLLVMWLVNLSGRPSVRYGIPYAVMARAAMGVRGARFPALVRGIVAIFWYGVQTYFASTAVALAISAVFAVDGVGGGFLGLSGIDWIAYVIVAGFQIGLFLMGIEWVGKFLNWAGPFVYLVMIALALIIWWKAGNGIFSEIGVIFQADAESTRSPVVGFIAVVGTMVAYFAAVVINFGDFSRFVKTEGQMRRGNFWGLPVSMAFFSFIALFITAGSVVLFGERLTDPTAIVERVDSLALTLIAAVTFFAATVGINLVANFIPAAYDIANMAPASISAKTGGVIAALIAFVIGALWLSLISTIGIAGFVDTLGAILAPLYGILIADYYVVQKRHLVVQDLFTEDPTGRYYYDRGWNMRAIMAVGLAALFSIGTVWLPALQSLSGFGWLIGAGVGGVLYILFCGSRS
ncbi:MAG: NCS1 family nucleobase:cation symporter-1 [Paracoccus sp. (in: a-proteobacteria)]|uniref:NCS1 family nucleobase:cation symporter-1 n=1 Tax=Paracoccus sp. TaxID=267 RepID=UPI0030034E24